MKKITYSILTIALTGLTFLISWGVFVQGWFGYTKNTEQSQKIELLQEQLVNTEGLLAENNQKQTSMLNTVYNSFAAFYAETGETETLEEALVLVITTYGAPSISVLPFMINDLTVVIKNSNGDNSELEYLLDQISDLNSQIETLEGEKITLQNIITELTQALDEALQALTPQNWVEIDFAYGYFFGNMQNWYRYDQLPPNFVNVSGNAKAYYDTSTGFIFVQGEMKNINSATQSSDLNICLFFSSSLIANNFNDKPSNFSVGLRNIYDDSFNYFYNLAAIPVMGMKHISFYVTIPPTDTNDVFRFLSENFFSIIGGFSRGGQIV